jgi:Bacterial protein of unknown function (DUF899)
MWLDSFNGIARHVTQRANPAVVAAAPIQQLRAHARHRGWSHLPLLSSASFTFKTDLQTQTPEGGQRPAISVFTRADDGTVRHFYTGEPTLDENTWGGLDGSVRARPGTADDPDAVLAGPPDAVIGVLRSRLDIAEARRRGLRIEGDMAAIRRLQRTPSPQP